MDKNPLVSIIVPVYNAEDTIGAVMECLINGNYRNIELIVVDDGSTDDTLKVASKVAKRDRRVIVLTQENAGPSAARNAGLVKAGGECVMFVDADDTVDRDIIAVLVAAMTDNFADFAMCGMVMNKKTITIPTRVIKGAEQVVDYTLKSLLINNLMYGPWCKLFKHDIIESEKLRFDESMRYGEDTVFVLGYMKHVDVLANVGRSLYMYNYTNNGLGHSGRTRTVDRKKRAEALNYFIKDYKNFKVLTYSVMVSVRWRISFIKARMDMKE